MELIQIVDKNGNFTGEVMDKEEAHDKNLLHNEVAAFIINGKGQVLLQKRSVNKRFNPNKWALCAGHVDAYESLESAILREIKEEIGIDVNPNELMSFGEREFTIRDLNSHITKVIEMIKLKDESIVFREERLKLFEQLKNVL